MLSNAEVTEADAREINKILAKLSGGRKKPLLADIRQIKSVTRGARSYFAGDVYNEIIQAAAAIISSPLSRIIGNLFLGINKPPYPMKLFTSKSEAIEWLRGFV